PVYRGFQWRSRAPAAKSDEGHVYNHFPGFRKAVWVISGIIQYSLRIVPRETNVRERSWAAE
ncbi:MAG: hypothetical protein VX236_06600, partial [Pseudomonadota bacterium]|nr:hypothetical protein [Pseudomonadota bacterium]